MLHCDACPYDVRSSTKDRSRALWQHIWRCHPETLRGTKRATEALHCDSCGQAVRKRASLSAHMAARHAAPNEPLTCDVCGFTTLMGSALKTLKSFRNHVSTHHVVGETTLACDTCDRQFTRPNLAMAREALRLHTVRWHLSEQVWRPWAKRREPCARVRAHTDCDDCGRKFRTRGGFLKHWLQFHFQYIKPATVRWPKPLPQAINCDRCGFIASDTKNVTATRELYVHIIERHKPMNFEIQDKVSCDNCEFTVRHSKQDGMKAALWNHQLTSHLSKANFRAVQAYRAKHNKKPNKRKNYFCNECGLKYYHGFAMAGHYAFYHSNERSKQVREVYRSPLARCDFCGYTVRGWRYLAAHWRSVHERKIPRKLEPRSSGTCEDCGKTQRRDALFGHWRRSHCLKPRAFSFYKHSEPRALCDLCGASCDRRARLPAHFAAVHGLRGVGVSAAPQPPMACDLCDVSVCGAQVFARHWLAMHGYRQ